MEGISSIAPEDLARADELGYRVKLLLGVAVKTDKGIEQRVHPTFMVPKDTAIAQVMGVTNAVTIDADAISPITLVGPGAGGMATASAVVSDIGDIARGARTPFGRPVARLGATRKAPMQRHEGGYYIRLLAVDKPGTAATIAKRLAQQNISLESIVQRQRGERPHGGDAPGRSVTGAGDPDHLCDHRGCGAQGAGRRRPRQGDFGKPQVIRIEKTDTMRVTVPPARAMTTDDLHMA